MTTCNSQNSNNSNTKYSLTNDTQITGDDIAVKDMLVQKRPTDKSNEDTISIEEYANFILCILVNNEDVFLE